ncbi:MAG: hypothetical protein JNK79_17315 [Chitinophagaceae bacterium]|nr:hypothetical protein [Chitinophagaceae bacterium]
MRLNRNTIITLIILIVVAALYRVIPQRPMGFAPHWAMALFGGAVIKDKRLAFAFPIFSMFISDLLYHLLYINGLTELAGFYEGQLLNYLLFAGMTVIGFMMRKITVVNIAIFSVIVCVAFFLISNFFVWYGGGGWARPHTFQGLMMSYEDGLPFFRNSIYATLAFSALLFGAWRFFSVRKEKVIAG